MVKMFKSQEIVDIYICILATILGFFSDYILTKLYQLLNYYLIIFIIFFTHAYT